MEIYNIWTLDAEAETPILWSPDAKNWLNGKDPDAGKDWRQEEMTEDDMVGALWKFWPSVISPEKWDMDVYLAEIPKN